MIPITALAGKISHEVDAIDAEYQVAKADAIVRLRNIGGQLHLLDGDLPDGEHDAYPAGSLPEKTEQSSPPAPPVDPTGEAGGSGAGGGEPLNPGEPDAATGGVDDPAAVPTPGDLPQAPGVGGDGLEEPGIVDDGLGDVN